MKTVFIVFDLESTCADKYEKGFTMEVIEIGAVKMTAHFNSEIIVPDKQGKLHAKYIGMDFHSTFDQFVQPKINPKLNDFCTDLTSITQEMIDTDGLPFPEAIKKFQDWILGDPHKSTDYWLCSWGNYDRRQLVQDCQLHGLPIDWLKRHMSIKHEYAHSKRCKAMGMKAALGIEKFELEGRHHRGIDDAKNIAKIFDRRFTDFRFKEKTLNK